MPRRDFVTSLVYARHAPLVGVLAYYLLRLLGVEIPRKVQVGANFRLEHGGVGVVIHSKAKIGANVRIYPGVTVGRADVYLPAERSKFESVVIEDDVLLGTGAKVLCKKGTLRVGRGTVIGANAVLLTSTGEYELWAGIPARKVGNRPANDGDTHDS